MQDYLLFLFYCLFFFFCCAVIRILQPLNLLLFIFHVSGFKYQMFSCKIDFPQLAYRSKRCMCLFFSLTNVRASFRHLCSEWFFLLPPIGYRPNVCIFNGKGSCLFFITNWDCVYYIIFYNNHLLLRRQLVLQVLATSRTLYRPDGSMVILSCSVEHENGTNALCFFRT
jgi:hypothetical protein